MDVHTSSHLITAKCLFSTSKAIGFQMIVLFDNTHNSSGMIYVSKTINGHPSASVMVNKSGKYDVFLIPILDGTGITESAVVHRSIVVESNNRGKKYMCIRTCFCYLRLRG